VKVYHQPGRFGGWPANHGIWSWGNEILVGFSAGYFQDHGPARHAIDHDKPEEHVLARSRDGGRTWTIETRHRARPLAAHLVGRSDLDDDQRAGVEAMVALHRSTHGDTEQSLASISTGCSTLESLAALGNPELTATNAHAGSCSAAAAVITDGCSLPPSTWSLFEDSTRSGNDAKAPGCAACPRQPPSGR
jgi:hypothetical protein